MINEKAQRHRGTEAQRRVTVFLLILSLIITHYSLFITHSSAAEKGMLTIPKRPAEAKQTDELTDAVERIQEIFAGIRDMKGAFDQSSYIKDLEETQKYSGTFFMKKPSKMMWEYARPRDEKVIIDETVTWIHKKTENQVIKTTFSKEAYSQAPIALLGSMEKISDDFEITMPQKNALQLRPKRKIGFIKTLVLETSEAAFPVKMFTIFDTYGNIIMIELKDVMINPELDDSFFAFEPPAGAEVYDMSQ